MKQLRQRLFAAILLAGTCYANVWAADYPSEQEYFQEIPVVLSASRLSQPISETPNAMTVIDRDMITASGARNIADLFKLVPSIYVGYSSGHSPIVAYRGITDEYARRMQVLVDGRSVYLPLFGHVDWAELPLDINDIERVEVIRGPAAASHGSNSVQGVISIYTHQAQDIRKPQVSFRQGDAGVSDVLARFGGAGESWDYRVTLASRRDNGLDPLPSTNKIPLNDNSQTQLINTRFNYRSTNSDSLDIQLGYSDSSRGLGNWFLLTPNINTIRDQKTSSDYEQLTWLHTFEKNGDFQLSYYHIGRNMKDDRYAGLAPLPVLQDALVNRHDLEMQHTLNTSPNNRVVWGMGARQDSATSPSYLKRSTTWREYRLFAHDEWRINDTSLANIGAMWEKNALGQVRVSPRASYNHHLTPRHTLRASVSIAHRNPEMIEEVGQAPAMNNLVSAGGLSPEKAISREIGYLWQLDEVGSIFDVRAFHDQISNVIWLDIVPPGNYSFKSDFNSYHSGLEATLKYQLGKHSKLTVNYSHQTAGATPSRVAPIGAVNAQLIARAKKYSDTVPLNSGSLLFSHNFSDGLQIGAGFYHTDPVTSMDAGPSIPLQPLTRYVDFRVAQRFGAWRSEKAKSGGGEIALTVQNALSDHYFTYSAETRHQRHAWLTVTLGL